MNVVFLIGGRDAIPVRAIPLLTNWQVMSPDEIASALAHEENYESFHDLNAHHRLENGAAMPISPTWWERFPCRQLKAISERIKATELSHEVGYQSWREESQLVLPAGVFVWKDEFEMCYQKVYGPNGSKIWNTDAVFLPKKERLLIKKERVLKLALDFNPFIPQNRTATVMDGFEPQQTALTTHAPVVTASTSDDVERDAGYLAESQPKETTPSPTPVEATSASAGVETDKAGQGWSLKTSIERAPGYRWPVYQALKVAHFAGQPCPKAQQLLDAWKLTPPDGLKVIQLPRRDELEYQLETGKKKLATVKHIQAVIKDLLAE